MSNLNVRFSKDWYTEQTALWVWLRKCVNVKFNNISGIRVKGLLSVFHYCSLFGKMCSVAHLCASVYKFDS